MIFALSFFKNEFSVLNQRKRDWSKKNKRVDVAYIDTNNFSLTMQMSSYCAHFYFGKYQAQINEKKENI